MDNKMGYYEWITNEITRKRMDLKRRSENLKMFDADRLADEIASSNVSDILRNLISEIKILENCKDQYLARS